MTGDFVKALYSNAPKARDFVSSLSGDSYDVNCKSVYQSSIGRGLFLLSEIDFTGIEIRAWNNKYILIKPTSKQQNYKTTAILSAHMISGNGFEYWAQTLPKVLRFHWNGVILTHNLSRPTLIKDGNINQPFVGPQSRYLISQSSFCDSLEDMAPVYVPHTHHIIYSLLTIPYSSKSIYFTSLWHSMTLMTPTHHHHHPTPCSTANTVPCNEF